jgi:exopolysaccharide production protein ExoZ
VFLSHAGGQAPLTPPADAPPQRVGSAPYRLLDAWRGVAALWVVLLHVRLETTPALLSLFSAGGHLGVPMFFVISGYCIASAATRSLNSPRPVRHFLTARVRRIYPPYLLASLVAAALSLLLTALIRHHVVPSSQIAGLNLLHQGWRFYLGALTLTQLPLHTAYVIRVFWSLCYEVAFYAVVALLLLCAVRAKQAPRLLDALGGMTIGALVWLDLAGSGCPFPWNLWPQFGLGVLVYQILAQPGRRLPWLLFLLCGVLIVTYALRHGEDGSVDGLSGKFQVFFYLGFAIALIVLFRWEGCLVGRWPVRLFSWLGMFSYSLYLVHLLALGIVTQGLDRLHVIAAHPLLLYLVKVAVCIAGGRLFFHFCERPFLDTRQRQVLGDTEKGDNHG